MSIIGYIFYGIAFISPPLSIIQAFICKKKKGTFFENMVPMILFILQFVFVLIFFLCYFSLEKHLYNMEYMIQFIMLFGGISVNLQIST